MQSESVKMETTRGSWPPRQRRLLSVVGGSWQRWAWPVKWGSWRASSARAAASRGTWSSRTQAFFRACRIFTRPELLRAARSAAPSDAKRWKRIAEQRYLARPDWNTKVALMWLGDRDTVDLLVEKGTQKHSLVKRLASAFPAQAKTARTATANAARTAKAKTARTATAKAKATR